jgi:hypothetical protein
MGPRNRIATGLASLALLLVVSSPRTTGADPKVPPADEPDFKGKVVALAVKDETNGVYLENAKIRHLGGRAFMVGTYAKQSDTDDYPEMTYWVPIDQIRMITEFKNMAEARKAYSTLKDRKDRDR